MKKKLTALLLALTMGLSLAACSVEKVEEPAPAPAPEAPSASEPAPEAPEAPAAATEISLWTYPIGGLTILAVWGYILTTTGSVSAFTMPPLDSTHLY